MHDKKLMYLGPARPFDLPINTRAVLAGTPEQTIPGIAQKFEQYPSFRRLFVPISEIPKAKAQLAMEGSGLFSIYKNIKAASDAWRKEREVKNG